MRLQKRHDDRFILAAHRFVDRGGIGEVQIDHILYAVLHLPPCAKVKADMSTLLIISDIADEPQVAIGYLGRVFCLHDAVVDPEHFDTDFDFFLGGTKRVDHFADSFVELFRRCRALRTERRQNLHPVDTAFFDLPTIAGDDSFSGLRLVIACHENEILAVIQLGVAFIDKFGIVGDQAVLGLTEDLVQHRHSDKAAVDQFTEHISGAHTGELIRVANKDNSCPLLDAGEKFICQPHIHHGKLVHDDQVG